MMLLPLGEEISSSWLGPEQLSTIRADPARCQIIDLLYTTREIYIQIYILARCLVLYYGEEFKSMSWLIVNGL